MNEKFGQFIKEQRKSKALTQKELAKKLNISDKAVSKWEVGDSYPDISLLIPISGLFNITVDELLNCELNVQERKSEITKNLLIFNISANIVLIVVLIVLLFMTLIETNSQSSISFVITDQKQFMVISIIVVLALSFIFGIYNLIHYKKIGRGEGIEETSN